MYLFPLCEAIKVAHVFFLWGFASAVLDVASVGASLEFWGNWKKGKQEKHDVMILTKLRKAMFHVHQINTDQISPHIE